MQDDAKNVNDQQQVSPEGQQVDQQQPVEQVAQPQGGILNQTFGEVLQNPEAQERIMKAMHIGPEQFQQLLKSTEGNPIANMSVGQLFQSGFVQQAVKAQGGKMPNIEQVPQQEQALSNAASSENSAIGEAGLPVESAANDGEANASYAQEVDETASNMSEMNETVNESMPSEQLPGEIVGPEEGTELDPEQFEQMVESGNAQVLETDEMGNPTKIAVEQPQPAQPQKQSVFQMIKDLFR